MGLVHPAEQAEYAYEGDAGERSHGGFRCERKSTKFAASHPAYS